MGRILGGILATLGVAMGTAVNAEDGTYGKYETPRYEVVRQIGAAEVRAYEPHLLAEVAVRGEQRGTLNQGFRALAGYIFGGNEGDVSVSMTSPVTQTSVGDVWTVTFMMPTGYTVETLPTPNNAAVRFIEMPSREMITLTFSGRSSTRILEQRTEELKAIAQQAGLDVTGEPVFMFYDDPFTLPAARRNEVALQLR